MGNTIAIIQARMGSTRLPGKVMKDLNGKTVLSHVIERAKQAKMVDDIVIATTIGQTDDCIIAEALKCGAKVFRGSEEDVLCRYYLAAKENSANVVVRITSDCPLIDPKVIDETIDFFKKGNYGIVTNAGNDLSERTYPRGLDVEVFTYEALQDAYNNAREKYQQEHVTPYIYEHAKRIFYYKNSVDYSYHRWTLDTEEDWKLIQKLYEQLYHGKHDFYLPEILDVMEENPELFKINKDIEQKKLKVKRSDEIN